MDNNFSNHYVQTEKFPTKYVTNNDNLIKGYPKLQILKDLKSIQTKKHAVKPYGCRLRTQDIVGTVTSWHELYKLQFDVIMIGAMTNNANILTFLREIPLMKLCSKPGYLFIWSTRDKIEELTTILNQHYNKKFRRSEELIFLPLNKDSCYYPEQNFESLFENQQWHCWMCITGTVRRSTDQHLIHCNIDTDLQFESPTNKTSINAVPDSIYKIAENFSNSNRRLHIVPNHLGNIPLKLRPGWVIISPDILINNFTPLDYEAELQSKSIMSYKNNQPQYLVSQSQEIEELRPKSPGK